MVYMLRDADGPCGPDVLIDGREKAKWGGLFT